MKLHIVEPDPSGRISGGYVYNHCMVAADRRHAVDLAHLSHDVETIDFGGSAVVLVDSLFLTQQRLAPFLELRNRPGVRVGVLLHAFPSFIERACDRDLLARELPLLPTEEELALLCELDLVVAPGPYVPGLLRTCGVSVRCVVCPPGIEPAVPPRRQPRSGPLRLISIGGVTPLKGFADGLRALSQVGSTDIRWDIVGHVGVDPEHVRQLLDSAKQLGVSDRVHFLGQRSRAETLTELAKSDVLFIPSHTENHPLVALEALALHVPVVGYAVGGLPDIVRHGQSALLAPLLDVSALAARLEHLLQKEEERQRLVAGCAHAAERLLSWEVAASEFERRVLGAFPDALPDGVGGRQ